MEKSNVFDIVSIGSVWTWQSHLQANLLHFLCPHHKSSGCRPAKKGILHLSHNCFVLKILHPVGISLDHRNIDFLSNRLTRKIYLVILVPNFLCFYIYVFCGEHSLRSCCVKCHGKNETGFQSQSQLILSVFIFSVTLKMAEQIGLNPQRDFGRLLCKAPPIIGIIVLLCCMT